MENVTFETPTLQEFTNSHNGTSYVPERRGQYFHKAYTEYMQGVYDELSALAHSEDQKAVFTDNWQRFQKKHYELQRAYLHSHSNVVSAMIAGPSNFPVRQMNKRSTWADNHAKRLLDYQKKAIEAIKKHIYNAATPEQKDNREYKRLMKNVAHCVGVLKGIEGGDFYNRSAFTTSLFGKLSRALDNGHVDIVRRVLDDLKALEAKHLKKPVFTSRHKIWRLVEDAAKTPQETRTSSEPVIKAPGLEIYNNHDAERVQIHFDEIPTVAVRSMLKSNGWKWSPRNEAWQRKNTQAGIVCAVSMAQNISEGHVK